MLLKTLVEVNNGRRLRLSLLTDKRRRSANVLERMVTKCVFYGYIGSLEPDSEILEFSHEFCSWDSAIQYYSNIARERSFIVLAISCIRLSRLS